MPVKHCCYGGCNSDSRYSERERMAGVFFINFPKPKSNLAKCQLWIVRCGRKDFSVANVTKYTYICSKHFVGGQGPTEQHPDPIPAAPSPTESELKVVRTAARRPRPGPREGEDHVVKRCVVVPLKTAHLMDHSYSFITTVKSISLSLDVLRTSNPGVHVKGVTTHEEKFCEMTLKQEMADMGYRDLVVTSLRKNYQNLNVDYDFEFSGADVGAIAWNQSEDRCYIEEAVNEDCNGINIVGNARDMNGERVCLNEDVNGDCSGPNTSDSACDRIVSIKQELNEVLTNYDGIESLAGTNLFAPTEFKMECNKDEGMEGSAATDVSDKSLTIIKHSYSVQLYECHECGKLFKHKNLLELHFRAHNGEVYKCFMCGKSFPSRLSLGIHSRIHTGMRPYKCTVCPKTFPSNYGLVVHTRTHTGERPYKCTECGKLFNRKGHFISHTRTHTGEKPYRCTVCGKYFRQSSTLVIHTREHTGEKPYKCAECGMSFKQKGNLIGHIRTHTGERPFKCTVCGKSFKLKGELVNHSRIHTDERPYKCVECGMSYAKRNTLENHMQTHWHSIQV